MHNEIQDVLGQSFGLPDDLDEDDLMGELDALDDEMAAELDTGGRAGVPSYLQVLSLPNPFSPCCSLIVFLFSHSPIFSLYFCTMIRVDIIPVLCGKKREEEQKKCCPR